MSSWDYLSQIFKCSLLAEEMNINILGDISYLVIDNVL